MIVVSAFCRSLQPHHFSLVLVLSQHVPTIKFNSLKIYAHFSLEKYKRPAINLWPLFSLFPFPVTRRPSFFTSLTLRPYFYFISIHSSQTFLRILLLMSEINLVIYGDGKFTGLSMESSKTIFVLISTIMAAAD